MGLSASLTAQGAAPQPPASAPAGPGMLWALARRDLRLVQRRWVDAGLPLGFFLMAAGLFPLAVGPEPLWLQRIAPGVVWVCALLACLMSAATLWVGDLQDGSLEQILLSRNALTWLVGGKVLAHWLSIGLPLVLAAPLIALQCQLPAPATAVLVASLALGTPVLSLLGALGAALALGLRSAGVLVFVLVLPLAVPVLVFGSGAVQAAGDASWATAWALAQPHLSLLGAVLIFTLLGAPWATAAALRISLD